MARATEYLAAEGRFTVSVLSVMEVVYGFHRLGREDRIEQFGTLIAGHDVLAYCRRQLHSPINDDYISPSSSLCDCAFFRAWTALRDHAQSSAAT